MGERGLAVVCRTLDEGAAYARAPLMPSSATDFLCMHENKILRQDVSFYLNDKQNYYDEIHIDKRIILFDDAWTEAFLANLHGKLAAGGKLHVFCKPKDDHRSGISFG